MSNLTAFRAAWHGWGWIVLINDAVSQPALAAAGQADGFALDALQLFQAIQERQVRPSVFSLSCSKYFTPRHVIDMCVKMLNPQWDEYVIDTAAGSCGFRQHFPRLGEPCLVLAGEVPERAAALAGISG